MAAVDLSAFRRYLRAHLYHAQYQPGAKIVYAWTTYILLRVIYTVNNVPYASLNAVMTSDPDERNSISTYRQIAANSAALLLPVSPSPWSGSSAWQ